MDPAFFSDISDPSSPSTTTASTSVTDSSSTNPSSSNSSSSISSNGSLAVVSNVLTAADMFNPVATISPFVDVNPDDNHAALFNTFFYHNVDAPPVVPPVATPAPFDDIAFPPDDLARYLATGEEDIASKYSQLKIAYENVRRDLDTSERQHEASDGEIVMLKDKVAWLEKQLSVARKMRARDGAAGGEPVDAETEELAQMGFDCLMEQYQLVARANERLREDNAKLLDRLQKSEKAFGTLEGKMIAYMRAYAPLLNAVAAKSTSKKDVPKR